MAATEHPIAVTIADMETDMLNANLGKVKSYTNATKPTPAVFGVGPIWIDGIEYWSDGISFSIATPTTFIPSTGERSTEIQAEIDKLAAANGGSITFAAGNYLIASTLIIKQNVSLILQSGAEFYADTDITIVKIAFNGAKLSGGRIRSTLLSSIQPLILIQSDNSIPGFDRKVTTGIFNKTKVDKPFTSTGRVGTGIKLVADSTATASSYINYICIDAVISDMGNGLHLYCNELSGGLAFINGNLFYINYEDCINYIVLETAGTGIPAISANQFIGNNIQADAQSIKAIKCVASNYGTITRNIFSPFIVWDWNVAADPIAVSFPVGTVDNTIHSLDLTETLIDINRDDNTLSSPLIIRKNIDSVNSIVNLPTPSLYRGETIYLDDPNFRGTVISTGTRWTTLVGAELKSTLSSAQMLNIFDMVAGTFFQTPFTSTAGDLAFLSTDVDITLNQVNIANTFVDDDVVRITSTGAVMTGITADTDYFITASTSTSFKLSLTRGGAEIDLTAAGSGNLTVSPAFILDLSAGIMGGKFHFMNYLANKSVVLKIGAGRAFSINSVKQASNKQILMGRFSQFKLEFVENNNADFTLLQTPYSVV